MNATPSDALVFFGATGDLAHKKIFPALQAMVKRGALSVPVVCVARAGWNRDQLVARALDSLEKHGGVDPQAAAKLCGLMQYIDGDYADAATFRAVRAALGNARAPVHYLAIPPAMFTKVVEQLAGTGCAEGARVVVEKPFGRDAQSARELNRTLLGTFDEEHIFRIDHYLGKRPVQNMVFFRFTNHVLETFLSREHVSSVQITMAESFGIQGRGAFYDATGTVRDVVQNHLFQVLTNLLMEPPARIDSESQRDEKVKVLRSIATIEPGDIVRGQYTGYLAEPGVAPGSEVETFVALRLRVDNWRWMGVPVYVRAGKSLPVSCTEITVRLHRPPAIFPAAKPIANYLRFRISPETELAMGFNYMDSDDTGVGQAGEMLQLRRPGPRELEAYERVLTDAMAGDRTLFAREDYVQEAWRIVDPVLKAATPVYGYEPGMWGPKEVERLAPPDGWSNPVVAEAR